MNTKNTGPAQFVNAGGGRMPFSKYTPFIPLSLPDRTWPNTVITKEIGRAHV